MEATYRKQIKSLTKQINKAEQEGRTKLTSAMREVRAAVTYKLHQLQEG